MKKSELDPAKEETMKSALIVQPTLLDMTNSTTTEYLRHGVMELRHAQTITSASLLETYPEVVSRKPGYLRHGVMELRDAQTITSASLLETYLQAVSRKPGYLVTLSGRQLIEPMTMSPMIADQTLTLTSYPCSWAV
jgi:hypothetical protein